MIAFTHMIRAVQIGVVILWLTYLGLLLTVVSRLRRQAPAERTHRASFPDWVPVPRGGLAELYARQFPQDQTLRLTGFVYKAALLGLIVFIALDLYKLIVG